MIKNISFIEVSIKSMKKESEDAYLSLGSIVEVKGSIKKIMIIGRGIAANINGEKKLFDYVGVTYPEGLVGDVVLYIQHENIQEIVFEGFSNEEDSKMKKIIAEQMAELGKTINTKE